MASSCDSSKMQLSAILKLEFYKKKKDWKLSKDGPKTRKKSPPSPKITNELNKTYDGEEEENHKPEFDGKQVLPDNKDDIPGPPLPDFDPLGPEEWDPDLLEPRAPDHNLYRRHSWNGQPISGDKIEALGQDTQLPALEPYWQGLPELEIEVFDTPMPSTTAAMPYSIEVPTPFMSESVDDTADFMRGAHLALHSSEIDLNTTQECPCIGYDNPWAFSVKQLAQAIQCHKLALALLLEEGARREQLSAPSVSYTRAPCDNRAVTSNTNRLRSPDGILPGGHCAPSGPDGNGRGRGRLQQARKQYDTLC